MYRYGLLGAAIVMWQLTPLPTLVTSVVVALMPIESDVEIGQAYVEMSGLRRRVLRDRVLDDAVGAISGRVLQALSRREREQYAWQFQVVDDDSVNAFALPGGWVFLNCGLLRATRTPEEVAGVVAHEMGHVLSRHSQKRMIEERLISTLLRALVHEDGDDEQEGFGERVAETLARGALQLGALRFSRANEFEADARGSKLLRAAGIGVGGMVSFFEELLRLEADAPSSALSREWLSTHPATTERIRTLRAQVDELPAAERARAWSGGAMRFRELDWEAVRRAAAIGH